MKFLSRFDGSESKIEVQVPFISEAKSERLEKQPLVG
jgi:hypothetical protein